MKSKARRLKDHVIRHRAKYAAGATLSGCLYLAVKRAEEWNAFLEEHNLMDEFYAYED